MPISTRHLLAAAVLLCAFGGNFARAAESNSALPDSIEFAPCFLTGSTGNGTLHAECATWQRPLDPSDPNGSTIEMSVARLPSSANQPAKDAFTLINGGPGASSIDLLVDMSRAVVNISWERDIIVLDQRGTGRSAPMGCTSLTDSTDTPSPEQTQQLTQACLDELPHDPRFFTTSVAVRDLDALRKELGYEQLSVYGVSYGTRVAMQYARRYPEQTRALIVDGVVPPTLALGPEIALNSERTLQATFERCQQQQQCSERFPNLNHYFTSLRDEFRTESRPMTLRHPVTGKRTPLELSYGHLAMWVRLALYAPESSSLLPLIITEAAVDQNYLPIAANALRAIHQLNASMQYGMHNAVVCTEDIPFFDVSQTQLQALETTYMGADTVSALSNMCEVWPKGVIDDDMKDPLTSDVPTLVLSGEFDPITPPAYGEMIMPGLGRAKHVVAPGQGHGVIARGCIPRLIREFVETTDPATLDATCTEHMSAFPFFLNSMGPPP